MKKLLSLFILTIVVLLSACQQNTDEGTVPSSPFELLQGVWKVNSITTTVCFDESLDLTNILFERPLDGRCLVPVQEPISTQGSVMRIYPESIALFIQNPVDNSRTNKELEVSDFSGNAVQATDELNNQYIIEFEQTSEGPIILTTNFSFYVPAFVKDENGNPVLSDSKENNATRQTVYVLSKIA